MFDRTQLFSLERGGITEIIVHGEIVIFDGQKVLFKTRDCLGKYPARSLLKPFQFLATGLVDSLESDSKYVPSLGSISATHEQIDYLKKWFSDKRSQELVSKLRLPPNYPFCESNRQKIKEQGEGPSPLFHMCFAKHMAILECCFNKGWDLASYHRTNHPYHARLTEVLATVLEINPSQMNFVTDGCKLPTPVLSMSQMAMLYQRLAAAESGRELYKIQQQMMKHPSWIGGPDRVDTLIMKKNRGVIAKEGADGLLAIAVLPNFTYPSGLGIVVKLWVGYYPKLAAIAVGPIFKALGLKSVEDVSPDHQVVYHYQPFEPHRAEYWDISPEITESIAVWPGDKSFKRKISLDTGLGNPITLSSFETTVHVGAHTDAINHFEKTDLGIESHRLDPYKGSCQVIEIRKSRGGSIEVSDLINKPLLADRVLFKTGSFPNPNQFNEDFLWIAPETIEYMAKQGVVLVGIDTPSIDSFSSKDLPAHHTTTKVGMKILEGVVLSEINEGIYQLSCLPLRIKGADASPVRAVLSRG